MRHPGDKKSLLGPASSIGIPEPGMHIWFEARWKKGMGFPLTQAAGFPSRVWFCLPSSSALTPCH